MTFNRDQLPDPSAYFEEQGLKLKGPRSAKWKSTECKFHGGRNSMRVNMATGAWVCMACGAKGGDVLAYEIQSTGADFIDACKAVGAWTDEKESIHAVGCIVKMGAPGVKHICRAPFATKGDPNEGD